MPKRLRDGQAKASGPNKAGLGKKTQQNIETNSRDLETEVLALGGSKDDLALIADAPSGSELEDLEPTQSSTAKGLQHDLRQMVKELGIAKASAHMGSDTSDVDMNELEDDLPMEAPGASGKRTEFPAQSQWHVAELPALLTASSETEPLPVDLTNRLHDHAKTLLEADNKLYAAQNKSATSSHQFYSTVMSSGTLSDRISALTLSVQESPLHSMKALETLLNLAGKRSRSQAVEVLGALKDLFGPGALLPSDRKLHLFSNQPGLWEAFEPSDFGWKPNEPLPKPLQKVHLIAWAYEDWLKSIYFEVIKIIETWCNDEVVFARGKAVDYVFQLLREKPEQEANLLRLLVNKLGDSDKKVASRTSYNLLQLQVPHPFMKSTIISAIESDLLFRQGQSLHAKYYAVITLNQTPFSSKQEDITKKLLNIYFDLFTQLLAKPISTAADTIVMNKKGEIQGGGGASGKKARKKQIQKESSTTSDGQLREKIVSAILTGVNRAVPYTNTENEAFGKHMNTLFRVTHSANFNTSIQALMLIQQLVAVHAAAADRFYRTLYESLLDPRLLTTSKQALYLNLMYKAMSADTSVKRVKAFTKRLLQVASLHQPSFASAVIYLVRELEGAFPSLKTFLDQAQEGDSDEEEVFKDVPETADASEPTYKARHEANGAPAAKIKMRIMYDGRKRDPQYSNAESGCVWELNPLLKHFHPSVSLFASRLASHDAMPPKPDFSSNTLSQFLDRFVYRNPKLKMKPKGASIMQPLAGGDTSGLLITAQSKGRRQAPINSEQFSSMDVGKVAADEVFFHKYFSTMGKGKEQAKKKKKKDKRKAQATEGSEVEEDEDEDEIWQALVNSRPELEGSDDEEMESLPEDATDVSSMEDLEEPSDGEDFVDEADLDPEDGEELVGSDDDLPGHVDMAFADENEASSKSMADGKQSQKKTKKRKLKNLPVFAPADAYAEMLDEED